MRRLAAALAARQTPDFEAWESLLLQAARQGGAGVLETLLRHWQQHAPREVIFCPCGQRMRSRGRRGKGLLTALGRVPFARSFYQCLPCSQGRFPDDERWDIVNTTYSPGVRRLMARAGRQSHFAQAAEDLRCYAGLSVEAREVERVAEAVGQQVERWRAAEQERVLQALRAPAPAAAGEAKFYISFDGTGVPVRQSELIGRRGKQADGSARTREAKLGGVFTPVGLDPAGYPQRDPHSTTYVGAIESSTLFGWRLYAEARRRGLEQAQTVVALTDGARYNHTIIPTHFPQALHIVDLFHAYEHLTALAQILWGQEAKAPKTWRDCLQAGDITRLLRQAGKKLPSSAPSKKSMLTRLGYCENLERQIGDWHSSGRVVPVCKKWSGGRMLPEKILEVRKCGGRIGPTQSERGERSGGVGMACGEGESLAPANGGEKSRRETIAGAGGVHRVYGKARRGERSLGRIHVATGRSQLDDYCLGPPFSQAHRDCCGLGFPRQLLPLFAVGKNEIRVL